MEYGVIIVNCELWVCDYKIPLVEKDSFPKCYYNVNCFK